jgi:hypothetical protein
MWSLLKSIAEAMVDAYQNPVPEKFNLRTELEEKKAPVRPAKSRVRQADSNRRQVQVEESEEEPSEYEEEPSEDSTDHDSGDESHDLSPSSEVLLTPKARLRGKAQKVVRDQSDLTKETIQEVMEALMSLGYKKSEARVIALDAVKALGLSAFVEDLVKYGLKTRGRGPANLH